MLCINHRCKTSSLSPKVYTGWSMKLVPNFRMLIRVILSKECYVTVCQIINRYITTIILMYVHGCDRICYRTCLLY
jgi:hypothetical protein